MVAKKPSGKSPTRSSAGPSRTGRAGQSKAAGGSSAGAGTLGPAGLDSWLQRRGPLPPAIYLAGADEAAKAEALAGIKERWLAEHAGANPTVLRAAEAGIERVLAAAQGGSLFEPAALVVVLNVEEWVRSARTVEAAAEGVAGIAPGNTVVFVETAAENERKTLGALREAASMLVVLDGLPPEILYRWAERKLERLGIEAESGAIEAVLEASRLETGEAMNEIEKLADWAGPGGKITREDADCVLRPVLCGSLPAMARAVAEGQSDQAVDHLLRSLESGEGEGSVLFQLQTLVAGAIRMKTGQWGWIRDRENSQRLARSRSERQLSADLDLLYRVERAWKGGRGDVTSLLVRAVMGLSSASEVARAR